MKKTLKITFLTAVAIMMLIYLTCDIFSIWDSRPLKFAGSALIALFGLNALKSKESRFVSFGLMFTLIADVFLVLLDKYLYGVFVFILAQLCYTVYLTYLSGKKVHIELLKRILPALAVVITTSLLGFKGNIILPAAYAVCIGVNIAHSVELQVLKPSKKHLILMIGFIVFVIGDICVGLRHMPFVTSEAAKILYLITWISYPPSQIMLLSSTGALKEKD
jgi:uncharacterized membrane protein YhhN